MGTFGPRPGAPVLCRTPAAEADREGMNEMTDGPVVVGFDPSPAAARAMQVAAAEAVAAGVELVVVYVYAWPIFYAHLASLPFVADEWRPSAEAVALAESAAARLAQAHPGLKVRVSVVVGRAGEQLVAAAQPASLLVVGATGAPGLAGVLAGSVTPHVTAHAPCPVMVVRGTRPVVGSRREVCVGVDGTAGSLAALRFGYSWARARGATVRALYAVDDETDQDAARLRDWVAQSIGDEENIDTAVVRRSPASALVAASGADRLVVVGARRHFEIAHLMKASVAHALIRHAAGPIVVVPTALVGASTGAAGHQPDAS
jgi:nucleotide-binding universal stress UspA family protein